MVSSKSAQLTKYVQRRHIYPVGSIFFIIIFINMITITIIIIIIYGIIIAIINFFFVYSETHGRFFKEQITCDHSF